MENLGRVTGMPQDKLMENALDFIDSSFADSLHLITLDEDDADTPGILNAIGDLFWERYMAGNHAIDLDKAILQYRRSVRLTAIFNPGNIIRFFNLGVATGTRAKTTRDLADINECCLCFEGCHAIQPDECKISHNLGLALKLRFDQLGNIQDIERAITVLQEAICILPSNDPERPIYLVGLGDALRERFLLLGNVSDIEASVETLREADSFSDTDTHRAICLDTLGNALRSRYDRLGNLSDLGAAIDSQQKAVELIPDGHPGKPTLFNNLGNAMRDRFGRLGNLADLESAIEFNGKAVKLTADGDPDKPSRLSNLASGLKSRFDRLRNISDLEAAIRSDRKAVALTPDGHPGKPTLLNNLGITLQSRFDRLGDLSDLEAAIDSKQKAVELIPDGHPAKPLLFDNLGNALRSRFYVLGNLADLESAIEFHQRAVKLTPDGHPDKPSRFSSLGTLFHDRSIRLGTLSDANAAIQSNRKAVELTPELHTQKPVSLGKLASAIFSKLMRFGQGESDLHMAMDALAASAQSPIGDPRFKLTAARSWALASNIFTDGRQALQAYTCVVSLIPQAVWMGLAIEGRHKELGELDDFVSRAVETAVRSGRPDLALEWLEQCRSIVWSQTLQLRSPFDALRDRDPTRAQRLTEISLALESDSKDTSLSMEESGRRLREHSLEWERLISEVRQLEGFEDFLGPKKIAQLFLAASFAPIVVLSPHRTGCIALILIEEASEVIHLPLQLTSKRIEELLDSLGKTQLGRSLVREAGPGRHFNVAKRQEVDPERRIKVLLAELWKVIVKPVLDALAFSLPDNAGSDLPRICWCPTGSLTFLPIHAAGLYDTEEPGTKVFEFVVSSYTPTLSALLQPPSGSPSLPKILAVSQAQYADRGVSALPSTKQEIGHIRDRARESSVEFAEVGDGACTVERVLEEMNKSSWIHLACHGVQNMSNPTKSAFILADDNLELEEIIKHPLPHAEFAFLSACQTAAGDAKLADEAIHLAAGMMLAGYRSVIATMWSMYDEDGPTVADVVYAEMLKNGKADYSRAPYALHKATQKLRAAGRPFLAWMPFIHMGV